MILYITFGNDRHIRLVRKIENPGVRLGRTVKCNPEETSIVWNYKKVIVFFWSMSIIDQNMDKIRKLCEQHKVSQLSVFGSILTNKFSENSDIDLLVDFSNIDLQNYADNYFSLKQALEEIFRRQVDLLENKAIKNPYLRQSIEASKRLLYES